MARVSTYLNFPRTTEAAFVFYKSVFKTEFVPMPGDGSNIARLGDMPPNPAQPIAEAEKNLVMHVALPILGGHVLMGTDATESTGYKLVQGNNFYINLEPDTRAETDRLFAALAVGGQVETALADMFWGAYFGSLIDQFGVRWLFNCEAKT